MTDINWREVWKTLGHTEKVTLIKELQSIGFLLKDVAEVIGISEPTIRTICQRYGIQWQIGGRVGNVNARVNGLGKNTIKRKAQNVVIEDGRNLRLCEKCGIINKSQNHPVHHKDRNRANNSPDNLIVLCSVCHALEHKKGRNSLGQFV